MISSTPSDVWDILEQMLICCAPEPGGRYNYEQICWDVEQLARKALDPKHIILGYPGPKRCPECHESPGHAFGCQTRSCWTCGRFHHPPCNSETRPGEKGSTAAGDADTAEHGHVTEPRTNEAPNELSELNECVVCGARSTGIEPRCRNHRAGATVPRTQDTKGDDPIHAECSYALDVADKIRHKLEAGGTATTTDLQQWWNILLGNHELTPGAPVPRTDKVIPACSHDAQDVEGYTLKKDNRALYWCERCGALWMAGEPPSLPRSHPLDYPLHTTPVSKEVEIERLCDLLHKVWRKFDPLALGANDCFCQKGTGRFPFRSSGQALAFVESVVLQAIGIDPRSDSAKDGGE